MLRQRKWCRLHKYIHKTESTQAYGKISRRPLFKRTKLNQSIWPSLIPHKITVFVWRLVQDRLPAKDNLNRRNVLVGNQIQCVIGCGETEFASHLFFGYPVFTKFWRVILNCLGIYILFYIWLYISFPSVRRVIKFGQDSFNSLNDILVCLCLELVRARIKGFEFGLAEW